MSHERTLTLASNLDEMPKLEAFIVDLYTTEGLSDDLFGDMMLAITEAVTNAIVHGNQFDPNKNVEIVAHLEEDSISISVKDYGNGFDPLKLPDPLQEKNLLKSGGRGVYLIHQFSDKVSFEQNGTLIKIRFTKSK